MTTLLLNGRVHSPAIPDATAMAVSDGIVAWLGSDDVGRQQFPDVQMVDLDGGFVAPAFVDSHVHLTATGLTLAGLDLRPWMSVVAPAGTPAPVLQRLNSEINKALTDRDFVQRLRQVGVEPTPLTVAAFDDFIRNDSGRWAELVKISGAKAE